MASYFGVFFLTSEGFYAVEFPDFPEAFTQGETLEECVYLGTEVLSITVSEYAKARKPLPEASNLDAVAAWAKEQMDDDSLDQNTAPFIQLFQAPDVDMTPVRVTISLPKSTLEDIDRRAKQTGYTRSGFLAHAAQSFGA